MAAPQSWDDFYRSVGITRKEQPSGGLTSRTVNTVAVDPLTGIPRSPPNYGNYVAQPKPARMLPLPSSPPNEVMVPGLTRTGNGYQSGQTFPDSYRLLPQPAGLPNPAVEAADAMTLYGDYVAQPKPARMFPQPPMAPDYGGGMTPGEADPWAGLRSPGEQIAPKAPQPVVRLGTDGYLYTTSTDGRPVSMGRADMSQRPDELYASKHGRTLPTRSEARRSIGSISGTGSGSRMPGGWDEVAAREAFSKASRAGSLGGRSMADFFAAQGLDYSALYPGK